VDRDPQFEKRWSNVRQAECQIKFGEDKEISIQELLELGLPTCVATPLLSMHRLEEMMNS